MKNWISPAITIAAFAAMSHLASAQAGDKMAKPMDKSMGKAATYTGCIEAGPTAGSFMLAHATADSMGKDAMKKDMMKKDAMKKDAMAKDAMAKDAMPAGMAISSTAVDLSAHVGHQVAVTGSKASKMAQSDDMAKGMAAFTVTSVKMIAATCSM